MSTPQSITCWFWYLLFLFILFVDLFKPLLQKTFVEGIVKRPKILNSSIWVSCANDDGRVGDSARICLKFHRITVPLRNWPEALQLTFDLSMADAPRTVQICKKQMREKVQLKPSKTQDPLQLPQCVTWRGTGIQSVRSLITSLYHCVSLLLWSICVLLSFKANLLISGVSSIGSRSNYNFPSPPCHTFNSMSLVRIDLKRWNLLNIQNLQRDIFAVCNR